MIRRGLLHFVGVALFGLCAALAAGWVRSGLHQDVLYRFLVDAKGELSLPMLLSDNGRLVFIYRWRPGPSVGAVRSMGWQLKAGPHFMEYEEVRWATYRNGWAASTKPLRRIDVVFRYWFLLTGTLLLGLIWFQLERRYRKGYGKGACAACGYDLTGNTSGVCPECGTVSPKGESSSSHAVL